MFLLAAWILLPWLHYGLDSTWRAGNGLIQARIKTCAPSCFLIMTTFFLWCFKWNGGQNVAADQNQCSCVCKGLWVGYLAWKWCNWQCHSAVLISETEVQHEYRHVAFGLERRQCHTVQQVCGHHCHTKQVSHVVMSKEEHLTPDLLGDLPLQVL